MSTISNSSIYRHPLLTSAVKLLMFLVLTLHLLEFPREPYTVSHDSSSSATFEYYAAKKVQFGTDIFQNVGPLGYAHYQNEYAGYLPWAKAGLKAFSCLVLALLVWWMLNALEHRVSRYAWFGLFFFPYLISDPIIISDCTAYLSLYLAAIWLLQPPGDRRSTVIRYSLCFFIAFMCLVKNTFFLLGIGSIVLSVLEHLYRRRFAVAASVTAAWAGSLAALWSGAGQHISHLPGFVTGIFAFSSGYNEAMALPTHPAMLTAGIIVVILFCAVLWLSWQQHKNLPVQQLIGLMFLFILWKHGFVRSDEHLVIFFHGVLLLAIPAACYTPRNHPSPPEPSLSDVSRARLLCIFTLCSACMVVYFGILNRLHTSRPAVTELVLHTARNISWLRSPRENMRQLEHQLALAKSTHELPHVAAAVGRKSIDFFGSEPGHLLLNDLNYTPRPMPIAFAAANSFLQQTNARFYRDPASAPAFVLYQPGTIDNRLSLQDDALARHELLHQYRPLLVENNLLLFERASETAPNTSAHVLREDTIHFGQPVNLPDAGNALLWLEVSVRHSLLGRLRGFAYKVPPVFIDVQFEHDPQPRRYTFITSMGECGFQITPWLETIEDVNRYFSRNGTAMNTKRVARISFIRNSADAVFFNNTINLRWKLLK